MKFLSKIFSGGANDILDKGSKIIDNLTTSDHEKSMAKNELTDIVMTSLANIQNAQKEIIVTESSGNWLQRSWRPIVMLSFAFIVVYSFFIQPAFFPQSVAIKEALPEQFWQLLELGIGGYVIGRSVEKVATTVTKNADLPFVRKKDRKDVFG
ncbi:MAG: 3TM-type holin [Bacteroidota bacterium]